MLSYFRASLVFLGSVVKVQSSSKQSLSVSKFESERGNGVYEQHKIV